MPSKDSKCADIVIIERLQNRVKMFFSGRNAEMWQIGSVHKTGMCLFLPQRL